MQLEYGPIIKNLIFLNQQLEYDRYIHAPVVFWMFQNFYVESR